MISHLFLDKYVLNRTKIIKNQDCLNWHILDMVIDGEEGRMGFERFIYGLSFVLALVLVVVKNSW